MKGALKNRYKAMPLWNGHKWIARVIVLEAHPDGRKQKTAIEGQKEFETREEAMAESKLIVQRLADDN